MKITILVTIAHLFLAVSSYSQNNVFGKWKTIDDATHEVKSIVEIYEEKGKVYGKVLKIFPAPGEDPDPVCDNCDKNDRRYNKKIIGMVILEDMEKNGEEYNGGQILDPENGNVYRCKIWLEDGKLHVRGYWGFFYRTQNWIKTD